MIKTPFRPDNLASSGAVMKKTALAIALALSLTIVFVSLSHIGLVQAAVPEFTVELVSNPFDVPTTYEIDPYTGENVTVQEGYHVENRSIEIKIKNQPASNLFYNIRYKGHFGESWNELYSYDNSAYSTGSLLPQSSSEYTVLSIPAFSPGAQLDFQVEALSWHYIEVWVADHPMMPGSEELGHYESKLTLQSTSGWSNTQSLTIPAPLPSPTLEPSISPKPDTVPCQEPFPTVPVVAFVASAIVVSVGIALCFRKRKSEANT